MCQYRLALGLGAEASAQGLKTLGSRPKCPLKNPTMLWGSHFVISPQILGHLLVATTHKDVLCSTHIFSVDTE